MSHAPSPHSVGYPNWLWCDAHAPRRVPPEAAVRWAAPAALRWYWRRSLGWGRARSAP